MSLRFKLDRINDPCFFRIEDYDVRLRSRCQSSVLVIDADDLRRIVAHLRRHIHDIHKAVYVSAADVSKPTIPNGALSKN